ncbi:hypothetical protein ABEV22_01765 [Geobacillus stearothermophilus]
MDKIDWNIMHSPFWFETEEEPRSGKKKASGVFSVSICSY